MTRRGIAVGSFGSTLASRGSAPQHGDEGPLAGRVPVGRPLPDVPDHVGEPVAVRRKPPHGRGALVAVQQGVLVREFALPGVRLRSSLRQVLVAPGELGALEAAARRELPFRLARQLLSRPGGVRFGVGVGDMHHGMALATVQRALRPFRVPPVGPAAPRPPLVGVVQVDRPGRGLEHDRAGEEEVGLSAGITLGFGHLLCDRHVPGRLHEPRELEVGDRVLVEPEAPDRHVADGRLLRIVVLGAHGERAARNPAHALPLRPSPRRRGHLAIRCISREPSPRP